jgi:hypothetical protein
MIFTLAFGQAYVLDWNFNAVSGTLATFLLILFNHRKNIIEYRSGNKPITPNNEEN